MPRISGRNDFTFSYSDDFHTVPEKALAVEERLHGGFAKDQRAGFGHLYYGMPGHGLMKVSPDLTTQETIELPSNLKPLNFHSTKIGMFDGETKLILPANEDERVVVMSIDGDIDFVFDRPEFDQYRSEGIAFRPTDTALVGSELYVADGYGANYISVADLAERKWSRIFGGKTEDPNELGKYGTAHGLNPVPSGGAAGKLAIADRPHSRIEIASLAGEVRVAHALPRGSRPCGIDYFHFRDRWYAVVGSLDDPEEGRPAPIYILDAETYEVVSTVRPKEELGVERADHIHNVVWHEHNGTGYLVCQSWNPGFYFVLTRET